MIARCLAEMLQFPFKICCRDPETVLEEKPSSHQTLNIDATYTCINVHVLQEVVQARP